ncbi:MAG: YkgJ family cysteine cluster protein [Deltaproteobacteria bacterium]|nr:YkgJ family cysteine cluster protein [Deltaproteobacteria bacterium]MBW1870488.1 YkgJ family cysteine cluster protein [Deltaproteobacteria bacterium]
MSDPKTNEPGGLPYALGDKRKLTGDEKFCFGCHKDLACFTKCCADVNILLTPLDVLRLSRKTNMTTTDFLNQHTLTPMTKELKLPVVVLKMRSEDDKKCPFLGEQGCSVYDERPWSCRMYPLGMGLPPARAGEEPKPIYFLFEDDFCEGTKESNEWTVDSWRKNQSVVEREKIEAGHAGIVTHPWFIGGRQFDLKRMDMYYTACYDLDAFRRFVFDTTFLKRFELEDDLVEQMRTNDEALLQFAFRWLRFALFGEPIMTVREDAPATGRNQ